MYFLSYQIFVILRQLKETPMQHKNTNPTFGSKLIAFWNKNFWLQLLTLIGAAIVLAVIFLVVKLLLRGSWAKIAQSWIETAITAMKTWVSSLFKKNPAPADVLGE